MCSSDLGVMLYSHMLTTSKTVRTMIMLPIIITLSRTLGWDPVSLALPAALTIDWVVGLPISGKPNVILFSTNQYTVGENFKYGLATCTVGFLLLVGSGATWFHWLGVTPGFGQTPEQVTGDRRQVTGQGTGDRQQVKIGRAHV